MTDCPQTDEGSTIKEMLARLACLDAITAAAKQAHDAAKAEAAAYEYVVHNAMGEAGYDVKDAARFNGTLYGREVDWYAKVQDAREFVEWAEENAPHLIQPKPQKALLNQLVQQAHEDGAELPPGLAEDPKIWISKRGGS